jgi:hypothetical protein
MHFSPGPEKETLGEFELRLHRWLRDVAADNPDLPVELLAWARDEARKARLYRNTQFE